RTAERLSSSVRSLDFIGRLGGEEFAVLLPETPKAAAAALAERLRLVIAGISLPEEHGAISLTASFGVSAREPGDKELLNVLGRSDR
ncbi:diguanylate cyclase, partial [Acinetobacter baumannii]